MEEHYKIWIQIHNIFFYVTEILEVNWFVFAYKLFHEDFMKSLWNSL